MTPHMWYDAVSRCQRLGQSYVIITILSAAGSTPRETGTKMVVTGDSTFDTIGGGHLEYDATRKARAFLVANVEQHHIESYPLASKLGQCCGGAVKVLFEVRVAHCQTLAIFGAGHVAKALMPIVSQLPLQIRWIDNRQDAFSGMLLPDNVTTFCDEEPEGEIPYLPDTSWMLVLTHDHQLDYRLVKTALLNTSLPYIGMIGSDTKAKRFIARLKNRGLSDMDLTRLVTPVGIDTIPGKLPIEVAVSISAQLIQLLHQNANVAAPIDSEEETANS